MATEPGEVLTPDTNFHTQIERLRRPEADAAAYLELEAIGELTAQHVKSLQDLVTAATEVKVYGKRPQRSYGLRSPDVADYRLLSWACPPAASPLNCTSFIARLFPDIVFCRNRFGIADPASCRALNVDAESFGGCDAAGRLASDGAIAATVDAQARRQRVLSALGGGEHAMPEGPPRRRARAA